MKPCKVCQKSGVRIHPTTTRDTTEYASCANTDCIIFDVKIPIDVWESQTYTVRIKKGLRTSYRRMIEVEYE